MTISIVIFFIAILGFALNRKNIILMLICIEMILLAVTMMFILASRAFDDVVGQEFSIYVISVAGAESALGLALLVAFYRIRGSILLT